MFQIGDQRHAQFLPNRAALLALWPLIVDRMFDVKQGVDAANRLQCQRRDRVGSFALRLAAGIGSDIGQDEKRPAGMDPARRLDQRPSLRSPSYSLVYPP